MELGTAVDERNPTIAAPEQQWAPTRWLALSVLLAAGFMDLLDTSIVNVAIPPIRAGLNANYAQVQWMIAGYMLSLAVGLITFGRLGDIIGRKRVFLVGVIGFGIASLCCGLAQGPGTLVATRILQGLFAAAMVPIILSTIQVSFPRSEQPKALAMYSTMAGVAVMSGPLLAGSLLTGLGLSWRSIFLINVPVMVFVVIATIKIVPDSKQRDARRLDLGGVALVSVALFGLVFGLIQGRELGWPSWVFALLGSALPLFALFALYERHLERRGGSPLVSLTIFSERAFSVGLVVVVVFFAGVAGFFLAFTIFLQSGLGYDPLEAALALFPCPIGLSLASMASTKLAPNPGRGVLTAGVLIMAAAQAVLAFTVNYHGAALTAWDVGPVIFVFGLGMGLILPVLANVVISGVHEHHAGAASGVLNTGMQVGNAIGVAVIGLVLFGVLGSHAQTSAEAATSQLSIRLIAVGVPADVREKAIADFRTCFVAQTHEEDPAVIPPSCRAKAGQLPAELTKKLGDTLPAAYVATRKDNFSASILFGLYYEIAVFIATFALLFLLPPLGWAAWDGRTLAEKLIAVHSDIGAVSDSDNGAVSSSDNGGGSKRALEALNGKYFSADFDKYVNVESVKYVNACNVVGGSSGLEAREKVHR